MLTKEKKQDIAEFARLYLKVMGFKTDDTQDKVKITVVDDDGKPVKEIGE